MNIRKVKINYIVFICKYIIEDFYICVSFKFQICIWMKHVLGIDIKYLEPIK